MNLTTSTKPAEVTRDWYVVDATGLPLGRLASEIALRLRGKHKPSYTPHVDCGDNIVVINAKDVYLSGNKMDPKTGLTHYWHTNHPGGLKSITAGKELAGRFPERVLERAVKRMMPKNKLGRHMYGKLHVFAGTEHNKQAQKPQTLDLASVVNKKR